MTIRKMPKQVRSQQRVDAILDAAVGLFEQVGYEGATTNEIAARAGVPIGSLYQFFENKEAILGALADRYVTAIHTAFASVLTEEQVRQLPMPALISTLIDSVTGLEAQKSGFQTLFVRAGASVQFSEATASLNQAIIDQIDSVMAVRFVGLPAERRRLCATVSVALVKGMMALDGVPLEAITAEIKAAVMAYIRDFLAREGQPLPD